MQRVFLALICGMLLLSGVESPTVEASTQKVGYLPIQGEIDNGQSAFFKRALASAETQGVTTLIVHLTTDGGHLSAGREMLQAALQVPKNKPRMIAFVDNRAYSAGSLIAYGHDEILLTKEATLGDIGVITMDAEGKIEYLPEKIETVVRTLLRSAAQNNGWDEAKLVKMTARNQDLYRIDLKAGPQFVIEDGWPAFKAANPGVKDEDRVVVLGKDRLMSYTAREAVSQGMATALVDDLNAVYARLGVTKESVIDLSPNATEKLSWSLAAFAPLLAAAAVFFIFMEIKTPGYGLWGTLAIIAGVAFFVCQFYLDLANSLEVVLVLAGVGLIIIEIFVFSLHGLLAMSGLVVLASGLILAFMPDASQFQPDTPFYQEGLIRAFQQTAMSLVTMTIGAFLLILALPKMAVQIHLADAAAIDGTSAGAVEAAALTGQTGLTTTALSPSGRVAVGGIEYSAISENGDYIEARREVRITGARFGELLVQPT